MSNCESIYRSIPGGAALLEWFGQTPDFHDAEIISLELNRRAVSKLRVHGWVTRDETGRDGYLVLDKQAVVTFHMTGVVYLRLDGFSQQNVIGGLRLSRPGKRADVSAFYDFGATEQDVEIVLEPCYGMDGLIRCNALTIEFSPGSPQKE